MVVYVHASGSSGRQWKRWLPDLPGAAPDLVGSGARPPWDGPAPFDSAEDVAVVVGAMGSAPADLVGHSYGGCLCLYAALERPVRRIVLYEPPLLGLLREGPGEDRALLDAADAFGAAEPGSEAWLAGFVDWWNGPGAWDAQSQAVRAEFVRRGRKVAAEVRALRDDPRPLAAYAAIRAPILLLQGDRTPAPVDRALDRLATLPNVTRERVPDAGHLLPVVAPERLLPRVRAFLA